MCCTATATPSTWRTPTPPVCYQSCGDVKPVEIDITEELKKFQDLNMEKEDNMPTPLFTQDLLRELRKSDPATPTPSPRRRRRGRRNHLGGRYGRKK